MKVLTLNVCGIRASQKKGLFKWLSKIKPDLICLQEVRALEQQISSDDFNISGYKRYMSVAEKKGYSGVCIYTKETPKNINEAKSNHEMRNNNTNSIINNRVEKEIKVINFTRFELIFL